MKKYIIALLLVILPLDKLISEIFTDYLYILAYIPMIIGYTLYIILNHKKNNSLIKKILIILGVFSMVISLLTPIYILTKNLEEIQFGHALIFVIAFNGGRLFAKIIALVLLVSDAKNNIFKKNIVVSLIVITVLLYIIFEHSFLSY